MKLVLKNIEGFANGRLHVICHNDPCLDSSWHYHTQNELHYVVSGTGMRFVGDNVAHFSAGDLVLLGPYIPHLWRNDVVNGDSKQKGVRTIVLKFTEDFIGPDTFTIPAFSGIRDIFDLSKYGVSFGQATSRRLKEDLLGIVHLSEAEKLSKMLNILCQLSMSEDQEILSSTDMRQFTSVSSDRLDLVLKYISDNYSKDISLSDVANIACMTTNSFCRFFRKKTNKSFVQFLNEVRVRNACRILVQDGGSVSDVCYKVGYKSVTNFYKQFRAIVGSTPKNYKQAI